MESINKEILKNITILYVEDEETITEQMKLFFSRFVKEIYVAKNGLEGIELFNKFKPDIIITDIQMPKMNGLEMIRQINSKNIPIIITTAFSDADYFLEAIELKVDKFVIKPINLVDLTGDIQKLVLKNHLQDKLFEKENLLDIVNENVLMTITDKKGIILDASDAFCELTSYSKIELIGKTHSMLRHPDTPNSFYENMWQTILSGKKFTSEIKNKDKNNEDYWVSLSINPVFKGSDIIKFIAIRHDLTNKKKLEALTIEDDLTKIYNRRHFNKVIDIEIRRVKRENSRIGLLCLDIDHFKKYNDCFGHPKGDELLIKIAKTLKSSLLRASDYLFRMGGEEFCILFSGLNESESIEFTKEILKKIELLDEFHKDETKVTVSAGLVVKTAENIKDETELYKQADDALYEAKRTGRNKFILSSFSK